MIACPTCKREMPRHAPKRINIYWGPSPLDYGPPGFLKQALERIPGVEVNRYECWGNPDLFGKADLHVMVDWGEDATPYWAFLPPEPRVYWTSDTHIGPGARTYRMEKAAKSQRVFYSVMTDREDMEKLLCPPDSTYHYWMHNTSSWLPYAAEPQLWKPVDVEKVYDVGFIGHYGNYAARSQFISDFADAFGDRFYIGEKVYHEDNVRKSQACRLLLNHCQGPSTNMRTFEGMSMGMVVLHPRTPDLAALGFEDGIHLLGYDTVEEAIEIAEAALSDPERMAQIGAAAREAVLSRHTYAHRAREIVALLDLHLSDEDVKSINDVPCAAGWWA